MQERTLASSGPAPAMAQALPSHGVDWAEALRVWLRVAALSFGGPAGQIAVMHRSLVDEKRWVGEHRFLHAPNYCMLLPGPEAQQLAVYIGWLKHRTWGGVLSGGLFILPGIIAIMAPSWTYALLGGRHPSLLPGSDLMTKGRNLAVLAIVAGIAPAVAAAQDTTFEDTPLGIVPKNFEAMQTGPGQAGRWEVVEDDEAAGGRAVAQVSQDPTDGRFPLLIYMPTVPADVEVRTRLRPIAGKVDQAGGLAVRLQNQDNYYLVRANALEGNVRFYKVVGGQRQQLAGTDLPVASNQWHELSLRAEGERFTVTFDGKELFAATDQTFTSPGKVAFWTKADSVTRFDALDIKSLQ